MSLTITLPNGEERHYPEGITPKDIAGSISKTLVGKALLATLNGEILGLEQPLAQGGEFRLLTWEDEEAREAYRHTCSHIMAQAVKKLFPDAKLAIGPAVENGFYYDFQVPTPFTPDHLEAIEAEMQKIIAQNLPISRFFLPRDEALALMEEQGELYKVELINDLPLDIPLSFY
ncbi:MAG: TGS domain-containing protein, partial [Symbiobacteriaceae bacterium]|nr:TGS domain-containing protein [Symbiobacteriaceae bacterium]